MAKNILSAERLRALLDYNQNTGEFTHRVKRSGVKFGSIAGSISGAGYVYITVDREKHLAHRLAFLHYYGNLPEGAIDHVDGNRANNALSNLRLATISQNGFNSRLRGDNTSGHKGVNWVETEGKWKARGNIDGKEFSLGRYARYEDAVAAYEKFAKKNHGEFYKEL